jgi:hypothetical protein
MVSDFDKFKGRYYQSMNEDEAIEKMRAAVNLKSASDDLINFSLDSLCPTPFANLSPKRLKTNPP